MWFLEEGFSTLKYNFINQLKGWSQKKKHLIHLSFPSFASVHVLTSSSGQAKKKNSIKQ